MELNELDLRLRLLSGDPIEAKGIGLIYPLALKEIKDMTYTDYARLIFLLTLNPSDILNEPVESEIEITGFDLIVSTKDEEIIEFVKHGLSKLTHWDDIYYSPSMYTFYLRDNGIHEDRAINHNSYKELKRILEYQNSMVKPGNNNDYKPANEKAKKIADKLKKSKEKVNKVKENEGGDTQLDIVDIISAVTAKSNNINKFNVWDLTIYQLYDEYNRLGIIDQYEMGIQSILAGADVDKVDLKHWSSRI